MAARDSEPGTTTKALGRDPERAWRRLRENPDYVADWGVSAGPTAREAPPRAFRRQTEADLTAARWNLLAWEDPRHPQWAELFWADVAMVEARVAEPGEHAWGRVLRRPKHAAFGHGVHQCIGAELARTETSAVIASAAARFERITLAGREPRYRRSTVVRGLEHLKVRIERR